MRKLLLVSSSFSYLEIPWIRHILSRFQTLEVDYKQALLYPDYFPVLIVSENSLQDKSAYTYTSSVFCRLRRLFGLIHLSDEWFVKTNHLELYQNASFVIRNYFSPVLEKPNVFQIPLGICPNLLSSLSITPKPFADRDNLLHYSGQIKYSRISMMTALRRQGFVEFPRFKSYSEYLTYLCNTKYLLCPNGNTTADTYRLYEALVCGCIPITEKTCFIDYIKTLFSNHRYPRCPLNSYQSWYNACKAIMHTDINIASAQQFEIYQWWIGLSSLLPSICEEFISLYCIKAPAVRFRSSSKIAHLFNCLLNFSWLVLMQRPSTLFIRLIQATSRIRFVS